MPSVRRTELDEAVGAGEAVAICIYPGEYNCNGPAGVMLVMPFLCFLLSRRGEEGPGKKEHAKADCVCSCVAVAADLPAAKHK